ncbi:single-stranded DNA-binding protein [Paenarthrobacter sp. NPDC058040]|uniref:single-stranded DNA-binding protein n=1 Tax=unclassified Paenarthrobacter TaxID=2634190 RepID=UPI0036DE6A3D
MNDIVTLRGFVASEVKSSTTARGTSTASFRLGTTERRYDRASSTWVDGNTNWYTVQSFRYLAGHVGCSIKKGQRVIVVGRLRLRQWEHEGKIYHVAEVDAESVGHDLMWGSANFTRMNGASSPGTTAPAGSQGDATAAGANGAGLESAGPDPDGPGWEPVDDGRVPPGEHNTSDDEETGGELDNLVVDTATGEVMNAAA